MQTLTKDDVETIIHALYNTARSCEILGSMGKGLAIDKAGAIEQGEYDRKVKECERLIGIIRTRRSAVVLPPD